MAGLTVFEAKMVRSGQKRKREPMGDPDKVDEYKGPWREYVDQVKVAKPTDEEKAALEVMFADKKKKTEKKEEDQTIEESSMLHGELCRPPVVSDTLHLSCLERKRCPYCFQVLAILCSFSGFFKPKSRGSFNSLGS